MKNCFIKLLTLGMCASMLLLCSCGRGRSEYEMERDAKEEAIYSRGYEAGHEEGEWEGINDAQERFEEYAHWELPYDIEDKCGMNPEEAIRILEHYADGEPVANAELKQAIETMRIYYWTMYEAVGDFDKYAP